jgi:hypothetical protein
MADFVLNSSGLLVPQHLVAPGAAAVYCDESGNSGPNYLDLPQPFYVLAGWLIPDNRVVDVNVTIDKFRNANFRQRDELLSAAPPTFQVDHLSLSGVPSMKPRNRYC